MRSCVNCGHPVGQGDRHRKGACPPKPGHHGVHHRNKKKRQQFQTEGNTVTFTDKSGKKVTYRRGESVAGVHKKSASSKEK